MYDSKNRNAWQTSFVAKLHADMLSAGANHAVLSTNKFPVGSRQLHVTDGVIIANPARVVALVELLRAHLMQIEAMRVSTEQREEKTAAVYDYISSQRYGQLLESLHVGVEKLEAIDADEKKAHEAVWNKRDRAFKELERTRSTIVAEVTRIIDHAEPC